MKSASILLVDDDDSMRRVLEYHIESEGFTSHSAPGALEALGVLARQPVDLLITDVRMEGMDGLALLEKVRAEFPDLPVIVLTAHGTIEMAVEAMKKGAADYLTKPVGRDELLIAVRKALEVRNLTRENLTLRGELERRSRFETIVGVSSAIDGVREAIRQAAASEATVLITGESGTGKELVARAIHASSRRAARPLVTVNCAGIPRDLLESELFGHVRGAFTGAVSDKPGKFQLADGGTLFLDEIGDMDPVLQAKMLRALQEHEVERVGGSHPESVDIRVLAATNRDLSTMIHAGSFREDLYYRLNVFPVHVPPLRDRPDDIPPLVEHLAHKHARGGKLSFKPGALKLLREYSFPGNVRELENIVERLAVTLLVDSTRRATVSPSLLATYLSGARSSKDAATSDSLPTLDAVQRRMIRQALLQAGGNKSKAARLLDVPRHVLLYRMKKLGIE